MVERAISLSRPAVLDADAFADLYSSQAEAVFNYCLFRVGERAVAEDLTADTFERAWRSRRRYRPEWAAFSTWLFTIARRVITDWHRRRRRRPLLSLDARQSDDTPLVERRIEEDERQAALRALVLALDDREQELVALKFGAGLNNRQIARLLDKSETAVGSAVHRIVRRLRARLEEKDA